MHLKFTVWLLALYLLHFMSGDGNEAKPMMSHMDHSILVFFKPNDLTVGKVMPIYFRAFDPSTSPHFLPRDEAESIPFSLSKLSHLLDLFGFHRGSSQAKAMEDTLRECETEPIKGETKFCATSLESMLDFVHHILGSTIQFRGLSTTSTTTTQHEVHEYQNYTILDEPKEVVAPKMVACHTMPYPYAIFYCHYQEGDSKVFQVSLGGENGISKLDAIAVCHMNTSQWSPNHVSFRVLGIKPGSSPVCHFFPRDNFVWVPIFDHEELLKVQQM